jgi:acyl-CoA dehydrogenase
MHRREFSVDVVVSDQHRQIIDGVAAVCSQFSAEYWREKDEAHEFPHEFVNAMGEGGWLGITLPEEYGGSGLGITEAALMMRTIAESGAGMSGASAVHINIFGLNPVVVFGTEEQKARMLPPMAAGKDKACFGVTEPNVGLNTTELKLKAERHGDVYRVNGEKIWISTAQVANKILLLARTTPLDQVKKKTSGLSLFYTDFDKERVETRLIRKMGRHGVDSNMLFFENFEIPVEDRIGEEGEGFKSILHGLNPERVLVASEAIGLGRVALAKASKYAQERVVFGRPIGQNQGVAHPLAKAWMQIEAANLMTMQGAALYDAGKPCGTEANAAKYLAAEAAFEACTTAVMTLGGMGYAAEYDVERYLRECFIPRIAPVSMQMILNYVAEHELGLPKSY